MYVPEFDVDDETQLEEFIVNLEDAIFGDESDKKPVVAMALQPGTTKTVRGKTYVLNQNHRWTLRRQEGLFGEDYEPEPYSREEYEKLTGEKKEAPVKPKPEKTQKDIFDKGKKTDLPGQNLLFDDLMETIEAPTESERSLAASNGVTNYHRKARKKVAQHFIKEHGSYFDPASQEIVPMSQHRLHGILATIDLKKPVRIGTSAKMPEKVVQFATPGSGRGSFFATSDAEPEDIGISPVATAWNLPGYPVLPRERKVYSFRNLDEKVLQSTAKTQGRKGREKRRLGGGKQYYVPAAENPDLKIKRI